ncbi:MULTISPECIES: MOSC domain-containing protein [Bartonella]|uniref:MOSC domain-containing protein n=1 Tax=Bartonella TaxID=773 RepID=UPI0018DBF806|nr:MULTISPECIES: MOSC domain-containing protein [Bartonella]MBI0170545.1 MOSC domain-containing protein [Bartonella sp. W8167]MBI0176242.1 MOSC domain-containing protein [Bartonella apis]
MVKLLALSVGPIKAIGPEKLQSGIDKKPVDRPLFLTKTGFIGDEQADKKHHGGMEKAVHHYDFDHYAFWKNELGHKAVFDTPTAFGENLSTSGLSEKDIAVGDVYRLGKAIIEVSQGRQPCFRLNVRFGVTDMSLRTQKSGRTGWYYRVLQEGEVTLQDELELLERLHEEWTIYRLWKAFYVTRTDYEELSHIASLNELSPSWRSLAQKRLDNHEIEDWTKRLYGAAK